MRWLSVLLAVVVVAGLAGGVATPARADLAAGKILVANPDLLDPNFARTVVLLLRHSQDGALGVVLNRPTDTPVSDVIENLPELRGHPARVYGGGPVDGSHLVVLVRSDRELDEAEHVFGNVHVSRDRELLRRLARVRTQRESFRVYVGYAGWGRGQLEREMALGGWTVYSGREDVVFHDDPDKIWRLLAPDGPSRETRRRGTPTLPEVVAGAHLAVIVRPRGCRRRRDGRRGERA